MTRAALLAWAGLLALAAAGCGHARPRPGDGEPGETVEAEGYAPWDGTDELGTRQRSVADAQRKAVEKVLGVYISAKTRVDAALNVEQRILAEAGGYVRKTQVLDEQREGGMFRTRIRALVLYKRVGQDLAGLGLTKPRPPGSPKARVEVAGDAAASRAVRAALAQAGFIVIDEGPADLVVRGRAAVAPVESELVKQSGFLSRRARVELEAVRAGTGESLAAKSAEAAQIDVAGEVAAGKALEQAGQLAGEELSAELVARLTARVEVTVGVTGLSGFEQARAFADDIRLNPEVLGATLIDYKDGAAEFRAVTEKRSGEELAAILRQSRKFKLDVVATSAYDVRLITR